MAKKRKAGARSFALAAARAADERHCSDIVVLDLKGKSPATDYFVIATGTSDRIRPNQEPKARARQGKVIAFPR